MNGAGAFPLEPRANSRSGAPFGETRISARGYWRADQLTIVLPSVGPLGTGFGDARIIPLAVGRGFTAGPNGGGVALPQPASATSAISAGSDV